MTRTMKRLMIGAAALALGAGAALAENVVIGHFGNPTHAGRPDGGRV